MADGSLQVPAVSSRVLIVGGDISCLAAAETLAGLGMDVMVCSPAETADTPAWKRTETTSSEHNRLKEHILSLSNVRWIPDGTIQSLSGFAGEYRASVQIGKNVTSDVFGAVMFSGTCHHILKPEEWGLGKAKRIIGLRESLEMWEDNKQFPGRVIFLLDTGKDDPPDATENTLGLAHRVLMTYGREVSVLCRNMRVSTEGGETLYRTARGNGVVIYKYRGNVSVEKAGKCLNVNFEDEYSNIRLNLKADLLVVAEETLPPETAVELSSLSGVETDAEGYLQAENVWMYPTLTNRRGIFVFGEIHSAGDGAVSLEDARAAALEVYDLLGDGNIILGERVGTVDSEKCAVCLTCLRSCPHGAVSINGEEQSAEIVKAACYGCGICSAICPAKAITLEGHTDDDVLRLMDRPA